MAYDPSTATVDEVNAHLAANPGDTEAVLAAERGGKARTGILEGPHAGPADDTTPGLDTGNSQTVAEAGANATAPVGEEYEKGYIGWVPSRDGDNPEYLTMNDVTTGQA